jgi:hypothetical protein
VHKDIAMNPKATTLASDARLGLDTLLRRELKVGDPNDPTQLAQALMLRYQDNKRAQAIDSEARGLPFLQTAIVRPLDAPAPMAIDLDLEQVRSRVQGDLRALLSDHLTQPMLPELEGWQQSISQALAEGVSNARMGLDPARRDVAFAMRRQLGEYARLSRLVGLFSPELRDAYRALAKSLDDAASVILVLTGDAMANLGFSGGRFLLQTSYADLQARRDAALNALRRMDGMAQSSGGGGEWPRGLRAHRQVTLLLEARGQGELRSLLSEAELSRVMDELVQLASGGTPHGLRGLGSTAWAPLSRLRRFVRTVASLSEPASHELAGLVESLQLFIDGFEPAGGFRLLHIARPSLLAQSTAGLPNEGPADRRLGALADLRNNLADRIEGWLNCNCEPEDLAAQAALDRVLFELDRAIDSYANGSSELGLCEVRASATHLLTLPITTDLDPTAGLPAAVQLWPANVTPGAPAGPPPWVLAVRNDDTLPDLLDELTQLLRPLAGAAALPLWNPIQVARYDAAYRGNLEIEADGAPRARFAQVLHDEIANSLDTDRHWLNVVRQLATQSRHIDAVLLGQGSLLAWQQTALVTVASVSGVAANPALPPAQVPPHFEFSLQRLAV